MSMQKMLPWSTHGAGLVHPRAKPIQTGAMRRATDGNVRRKSFELRNTALQGLVDPTESERVHSLGHRLRDPRLPDFCPTSFVNWSPRTIAAGSDLLPDRCRMAVRQHRALPRILAGEPTRTG